MKKGENKMGRAISYTQRTTENLADRRGRLKKKRDTAITGSSEGKGTREKGELKMKGEDVKEKMRKRETER